MLPKPPQPNPQGETEKESEKGEEQKGKSNADSKEKPGKVRAGVTTMEVIGLPEAIDQDQALAFLSQSGFSDAFDYALLLPAVSGLGRRLVVNFVAEQKAQLLKDTFNNKNYAKIMDIVADEPLQVVAAAVQGKASTSALYEGKYWQKIFENIKMDWKPFSSTSVPVVKKEKVARLGKDAVTIIIRNLPPEVNGSAQGREWLKKMGVSSGYNFFLYVPPKTKQSLGKNEASDEKGLLGYIFINFLTPALALDCFRKVDNHVPPGSEGLPKLSAAVANVQGLEQNKGHFKSLIQSGRLQPWFGEDEKSEGIETGKARKKGEDDEKGAKESKVGAKVRAAMPEKEADQAKSMAVAFQ